jgi:transcriptional regulator NrdR family protein
MDCPFCTAKKSRVVDTHSDDEQSLVRRTRQCRFCRRRWKTEERPEEVQSAGITSKIKIKTRG